ncbi:MULTISPECIES: FxsA family membrane protein [unclassified Streptomyces]|uniref:FxsA family membrane protein n=1 Tax=unclassified Streptomyces TaxID=2593676 RepID=UPI000B88E11A|nr:MULTISPECIES: FxsA family membrane protein [unclassified Streptomyces]MYT15097.1 FxsA family protein [Streptomyces sp. SID4951]
MSFGATPSPSPRPPQRSRARRFVPLGIAAWMVLEIWLLTVVAGATNGLTVLLLLVGGVIVGGYVTKRAGRRAWRNLTESLQTAGGPAAPGNPPSGNGRSGNGTSGSGTSGSGNTLPMAGGLLLMLPGLVSDALGLLCLFPPTGKLIQRRAEKLLSRRSGYAPGSFGDAFQQARMHRPDGKVVQGEVIRDDEPPSPRRQDPPLTG